MDFDSLAGDNRDYPVEMTSLSFLTWSYAGEVVVTDRQFGNGVVPIIICDGCVFCGLAT